jgi:hypothetical protein
MSCPICIFNEDSLSIVFDCCPNCGEEFNNYEDEEKVSIDEKQEEYEGR